MARGLSPDLSEALLDVSRNTMRSAPCYEALEAKGLVTTGSGRYGSWVRITTEGLEHLAKWPVTRPAALPGPATVSPSTVSSGNLLRGVVPRQQRTTTKNARGTSAAIPPPAAAQPVGVTLHPVLAALALKRSRK